MLRWAVISLVVAIVAGILGFAGLIVSSNHSAQVLRPCRLHSRAELRRRFPLPLRPEQSRK